MRALSASPRFATSASILALDSAGKATSTYIWPMASSTWPLTVSSTRFQRGFISFWPLRILLWNS